MAKADYSPEFRAAAVRRVRDQDRPVGEIAEQLGIPSRTLDAWVKSELTLAHDTSTEVLLTVWKEFNETARDTARLRWQITAGYLTGMAAVFAAAAVVAGKGTLSTVPLVLILGLCLFALLVHGAWQVCYNRFLVLVLSKQGEVTAHLSARLRDAGISLDLGVAAEQSDTGSLRWWRRSIAFVTTGKGATTASYATHGMHALVAVSVVMTVAACVFVFVLGSQRSPTDRTAEPAVTLPSP